jgi:hypothetical protein
VQVSIGLADEASTIDDDIAVSQVHSLDDSSADLAHHVLLDGVIYVALGIAIVLGVGGLLLKEPATPPPLGPLEAD